MKWHFPDLEMYVVLVSLYPLQQIWHKGGRRGKKRREIHADEAAQRDVGILLVKIVFDGALRVEPLICFQCHITLVIFEVMILVISRAKLNA